MGNNLEQALVEIEGRISYLNQMLRTTYNRYEADQFRAELNGLQNDRDMILRELNGMNVPNYGVRRDPYNRPLHSSANYATPGIRTMGNQGYATNGFLQRDTGPTLRSPGTTINIENRYASKISGSPSSYSNSYRNTVPREPNVPVQEKPKEFFITMKFIEAIESAVYGCCKSTPKELRENPDDDNTHVEGSETFKFKIEHAPDIKGEVLANYSRANGFKAKSLDGHLTDYLNNVVKYKLGIDIQIDSFFGDMDDLLKAIKSEKGGEMKASYLYRDIVEPILHLPVVNDEVAITELVIPTDLTEYKTILERFISTSTTAVTIPEDHRLDNLFKNYLSNELEKSFLKRAIFKTMGGLPKYFIVVRNIETGRFVISLP